ncbi:MAG: zinc ABC transporter substrate-binding protein [Gammaproteobacteria bacterium]|nr:MAG: zinc ABC transporter substrate-binding protein [Gammaproteobacteria bacterium]
MRVLFILLCLQPALVMAAPRVVTSIAPLQEITSAVMNGVGEPQLIIDQQHSVHHFAFKPSHMRRLQQAELVIWISRHFESGFNRVPEVLPATTRQLELLPALGLEDDDGHIWYSPTLLQQSITIITQALADLDPANHARYQDNAKALQAEVEAWRQGMQQRWRNRQFRLLTDHIFLAHFNRDLAMFEITHIQDEHAAHGGLKDLERLEDWLSEEPAGCLLTLEPPSPMARSLAYKYQLPIVDITGIDSAKDSILWRQQQLASALETCLDEQQADSA